MIRDQFFPETDPPHPFTLRVVQHWAAISATAELLSAEWRGISQSLRSICQFTDVQCTCLTLASVTLRRGSLHYDVNQFVLWP